MSIDELQSAVGQLAPADLDQFSRWFEEYLADRWDRQIEADIRAGHLDEAPRRSTGFEVDRRGRDAPRIAGS